MPPAATESKSGKNLYVVTFDPAPPQGHGMSVKREELLDELTVQVWLLYLHPNFNYLTLLVSGTELRTNRQTDGQTIRLLDAPADLSGRGIRIYNKGIIHYQSLL